MASLKFYLDKALKTRTTRTVYLRYKTPLGTTSFYPDVYVTEAQWNKVGQCVRGTSKAALEANDKLLDLRKSINDALGEMRKQAPAAGDPAPAALDTYLAQKYPALLNSAKNRTSTKRLVKAASATAITQVELGTLLSVPALIERYTQIRSAELTEGTKDQYLDVAASLRRFVPENKWPALPAVTPFILEQWRQWLVAAKGEDVSSRTANNRCALLRAVLHYFQRQGPPFEQHITLQHLDVLSRRFKTHKARRNSLSADEMLQFYHAKMPRSTISQRMMRDAYCLSWCTSLRGSDIFSLQRHDIEYTADGQPVNLLTTSIKALKTTEIPLNQLAAEILLRWLTARQPNGIAGPGSPAGKNMSRAPWPESYVFPQMKGRRRRRLMEAAWEKTGLFTEAVEVVRVAGGRQQRERVPRWQLLTFHTARHGFGNYMAECNVPIEDTQLLMGHGSIRTTEIYYHRPERNAINRARAALDTLPGGPRAAKDQEGE